MTLHFIPLRYITSRQVRRRLHRPVRRRAGDALLRLAPRRGRRRVVRRRRGRRLSARPGPRRAVRGAASARPLSLARSLARSAHARVRRLRSSFVATTTHRSSRGTARISRPSSLVSRRSSLVSHRSSLISRRSSLVSHLSSLVARLSSLVARLSSLISRLSSRGGLRRARRPRPHLRPAGEIVQLSWNYHGGVMGIVMRRNEGIPRGKESPTAAAPSTRSARPRSFRPRPR